MKKLFLLVLILGASSACIAEETLYFTGPQNVIPFAYGNQGVITGYDYDIFMEIMKRAGLDVKVELLPFNRIWSYLLNGSVDGTFMIFYKENRKKHIVYCKEPMHRAIYHLIVKKGNEFPYESLKDLYGKRVGNQMGFFVSEEFQQAVKENKIILDEALSVEMNLNKLMAGRIDCFISSVRLLRYYVKKMGIQHEVVNLPKPIIPDKPLYLAVSRKSKRIKNPEDFVKKIEAIRKEMDRDGTMERINRKYF